MKLEEKLQLLRKKNGYSQEQLADKLGLARQTISKWETGQAVPELSGLIQLSELYGVTIDRIVKNDIECNIALNQNGDIDMNEIVAFLIRAKLNTYAGKGHEVKASRLASHDFSYEEQEYAYYDTYQVGEHFDINFLKEALYHVPEEHPFRGPEIYTKGDYHYHC